MGREKEKIRNIKDKMIVKIHNILTERPGDNPYDEIVVWADDVFVGRGAFGGEPEDNLRCRDYDWVQPLIENLSQKLGAKVEVSNIKRKNDY